MNQIRLDFAIMYSIFAWSKVESEIQTNTYPKIYFKYIYLHYAVSNGQHITRHIIIIATVNTMNISKFLTNRTFLLFCIVDVKIGS